MYNNYIQCSLLNEKVRLQLRTLSGEIEAATSSDNTSMQTNNQVSKQVVITVLKKLKYC